MYVFLLVYLFALDVQNHKLKILCGLDYIKKFSNSEK